MFITRKHLSRRTFLRGTGVTLALPLLESMLPAQTAWAQTAAHGRTRVAFIFFPHGASMPFWTPVPENGGLELTDDVMKNPARQFRVPGAEGPRFGLSEILSPLEPYRGQMRIVSGLAHRMADAQPGEKGGDHATPAAVFLSGAHAKMTAGQDVRCGITADQVMANYIGQDTPLPSLELGIEDVGATGTCGSGYSCAYSNTISWHTPTRPLPMEIRPRVAFERMFGDGTTPQERLALQQRKRSILDSITREASRLRMDIGPSDGIRLDQYLSDVREIERRLELAEIRSAGEPAESPSIIGVPESFEEHVELMFDLMTLAFQSEVTRVSTLMLGRELSVRSFPESGFNGGWHGTSHHGDNPQRMQAWARINKYHVQVFTRFLEKLRSTPEAGGSLLDHSMVLYASAMSNGNRHDHYPLPVSLFGGASGRIRGSRHVVSDNTPMSNLLLTMLDIVGIPAEYHGDSTGKLEI